MVADECQQGELAGLIIDRYLVRQVVMPFFSVATVLLVIFVGYSLSRFLYEADAGLLSTGEVALLTLLKTLIALEVLLPVGLFFGLMLALGKLHNESEIVAMQASGIGESRMIRTQLQFRHGHDSRCRYRRHIHRFHSVR